MAEDNDVGVRVTMLEVHLQGLEARLGALEERVEVDELALTGAASFVALERLKERLDALEERVVAEARLEELEERLEHAEGHLEELPSSYAFERLDERLSAVERRLYEYATADDLGSLRWDVSALRDRLEAIERGRRW